MGNKSQSTRRRTFVKSVGAASIAGLAGCANGGGNGGGNGDTETTAAGDDGDGTTATQTGTARSEGEIVIGNAAPVSGPFSPWGTTHRRGLEFAIQEINDEGGVLGRDLTVVTQDTQASPQTATTTFRRLVNDEDAVAVTGPVSSDVGIACRSTAEELQVPLLPNQASSPALLTKDTRYVFRVGGTATPTFVIATAGTIRERNYKVYAAIYADYAYGQSYNAGIQEFITPIEGLQTSVQAAPPTVQDVQTYLRKVPSDVDLLDLGGHPIELFTFIKQAKQLGLNPDLITGPNIPTSVMYQSLQDLLFEGPGLFASVDPGADDYLEVAQRFADQEDSVFEQYHAFGYTTGKLLAAAIEDAGSAEPQAIRDALSGIEYDSILAYPQISYTDWGELQEAKLHGLTFSSDPPSYYAEGPYSVQSFYESRVFEPIDPANW